VPGGDVRVLLVGWQRRARLRAGLELGELPLEVGPDPAAVEAARDGDVDVQVGEGRADPGVDC
jgi:hypothetical protein